MHREKFEMKRCYFGVSLLWFSFVLFCCATHNQTDEQKLLHHLFHNYNNAARPVFHAQKTVTVKIGLTMNHLDEDSIKQRLIISGWLKIEWFDELLHWDPNDFGGVERILVPSEKVWLPPFALDNSAGNIYNAQHYLHFKVALYNDGSLYFEPGGKFISVCPIRIVNYPFDSQTCSVNISGWDYSDREVNLTTLSDTVDLEPFKGNGEWNVTKTEAIRKSVYYNDSPDVGYPEVHFILHIQRKPGFYITNIVVPCFMLIILDLLVFILPAESGERISLGITIMLSFSVFSLLIIEQVPKSSDGTPVIVLYLTFCMSMAGMSIVVSVFLLRAHHTKTTRPPPACLMKCLTKFSLQTTSNQIDDIDVKYRVKLERYKQTGMSLCQDQNQNSNDTGRSNRSVDETASSKYNLQTIYEYLETFDKKQKGQEEKENVLEAWRILAKSIDNLCIVLFISINILGAVYFLNILPNTRSHS